jgi:predicted naringenin-chalcone synthase
MVEKWSRGVKGADMKIIVAAAVLSISLCSCSAYNDRSIYRNPVSPTVVGDGNSVLVSNAQNEADGQELAEKHCKRFGKSARFNRMEGVRAFFDCQSPS